MKKWDNVGEEAKTKR